MASPLLCIVSQYIAPIQGVKRVVELDGKFSNRAKAWRASKPCKQEKAYSHESGYPPKKSVAIAPRRCIVRSLAIHPKRVSQSRQGKGQAGQGRHGVSRQRGLPWRVLQPHLRDLHWYHRKKAHKLKQMKYGYYMILLCPHRFWWF